MKPIPLRRDTLENLEREGIQVPRFDLDRRKIGIVHFGVGGFHRAHQAAYLQQLFNQGRDLGWAISGVGLLEVDAQMAAVMTSQDCLFTHIPKPARGVLRPTVIGAMAEYHHAPRAATQVLERLTDPGVRIVTLTITESGYHRLAHTGTLNTESPAISHDVQVGLRQTPPETAVGFIVEGLRRRRAAGHDPFTVLSCDNLPGNGQIARQMVLEFTRAKHPDLHDWIAERVAFPHSMVDRITPHTSSEDVDYLRHHWGIDDSWPVVSEAFGQWIIEDDFPTGRPILEDVGVTFVEDVSAYELAKLRLLNCSHQVIAYLGTLLGYQTVDQAIADEDLSQFLRHVYMEREATPGLVEAPGLNLADYRATLIERFQNPNIRDTLSRLVAAQRIPDLLVPLIRENLIHNRSIEACALVVAAWAMCEDRQLRAPEAFLSNAERFGDLATEGAFCEAYRRAVDQLTDRGPRQALRQQLDALD